MNTLKQLILSSNCSNLINQIKLYSSDLEILYSYDRYMRSLQSEMLYLNNRKTKEKLREEFNYLTLLCEKEALSLLNKLEKKIVN